jgi:3D (Asp-Asp-Asp) domain-containing protein
MSIAFFLLYLFLPTPTPSAPRYLPTAHLAPRVVAVTPAPAPAVAYHPPKKLPTYRVTATVYMAETSQTDDEPLVTADNSRISPHQTHKSRWAAVSRDLLKRWGGPFNYGDSVRVSGISPQLDGVYIIHDTMAQRHKHCFDVLVGAKEGHLSDMWHNVRLTPVPDRPAPQPEWQAS